MNDTTADDSASGSPDAEPQTLAAYVMICLALGVMLVALFWPAGTIDWRRGWLFYSLFVVCIFFGVGKIKRDNPELLTVRRKFQAGTKGWDLILAPLTILGFASILPFAALDDARFHWAPQSVWVQLAGYALFCAGFAGTTWAQSVNRFFEASVRIQTDRGHTVVETGPYAWIRHPGYAFAIVMCVGMALSLGSLVALIPVAVMAIVLAIRTLAEDGLLKRDLAGYSDYAARVKHRWIPGVW
ncbi:MAG: isoprenylcysteine carboxylmethyltransferase family protein [Hyphomonadaceae bacterium]